MRRLSRRRMIGAAGAVGLGVRVAAVTPHAEAADYVVTTPAELSSAITSAQPGDSITMADGVWSDISIVFRAIGTPAAPITLRAQTPGQVIISGTSYLQIVGDHLIVDGLTFRNGAAPLGRLHLIEFRGVVSGSSRYSTYCRLTNVVVDRFNKEQVLPDGKDVWVGLFGHHNRVDHCSFIGKTSYALLMIGWRPTSDQNFFQIDHNYFSDVPNNRYSAAAVIIRIGDGIHALTDSSSTIESNLFERMEGIGRIVSLKCSNSVIRDNTFRQASGAICSRVGNANTVERNFILPGLADFYTGGMLMIGENHIIRNNYVQGCRQEGKAALQLYEGQVDNAPGVGGYYPTKNVTFENNTFADNDKNIIVGMYYDPEKGLDVPVENITYRENAILGNDSPDPVINELDPPVGDVVYEGNMFFGGNLENLQNTPGVAIEDPGLDLGTDGLYHYRPGSPLENNITTTPLVTGDVGPEWNWEGAVF